MTAATSKIVNAARNNQILVLVLQRLLFGLLTLWIVLSFIFLAVELLPGDLAESLLGKEATPEALAALRQELGLDRPIVVRYFEWFAAILHGDLGNSLESGRPVAELIGPRLYNTMFLAAYTAMISVPLSVCLGLMAALYRNSRFDRITSALSLISVSFPDFFVAYIFIYWLAVNFGFFPSMSSVQAGITFWEQLYRCTLPALTLSVIMIAHMMRMTRASVVNLLSNPYIEMAQLKGLRWRRIILWHALPNAASPIINVVLLNMAYLIVGVLIIEVVFVYPGLGQLLVNSVAKRDLPVVQACCMIFASTYIILNILADIGTTLSNPRLLYRR